MPQAALSPRKGGNGSVISHPPTALAPLSFWEPAQNCSRWICSWLPNGPCLSLLPLLLCLLIKHLSSLCQEPFLLQLSAIWNSYLINCSFFLLTHLKYFFFFFACISACYLIEQDKHSHLLCQFVLSLILLASLRGITE